MHTKQQNKSQTNGTYKDEGDWGIRRMKRKARKKEHKKKKRKKSKTMKTNESLKLWWEELMNINFYYSDYKIHFKIGWNTLYVCFAKDILGNYKVRKIIIQSVRHYLKPLEKADHLNHQIGCMGKDFKDSIFWSSADCTRHVAQWTFQ